MKKILLCSVLAISFLLTGCAQTSTSMVQPKEVKFSGDQLDMLEQIRPAVVGITADYDDGYSIGSGVAVENGNLIVTNNHVVEGGENILLYLSDEQVVPAELLWSDAGLDMAVLKASRGIPYLSFGSSEELSVGEEVYAVGTPLTLQFKHTVTKGIVSAKDRVVEVESDYGDSFMQSLIQHDASINPGNSGGPLIDNMGKIVGINTLKASQGEGIGFAIPAEVPQKISNLLAKNESFKTPYIGVFGFDSEIAKIYGYDLSQKGVFVISVTDPASEILQKGDLIVSFGGKQIKKLLDLRLAVLSSNIGEAVEIEFYRNGTLQSGAIVIEEK